jgi:hypothetical protein
MNKFNPFIGYTALGSALVIACTILGGPHLWLKIRRRLKERFDKEVREFSARGQKGPATISVRPFFRPK